MAHPIDGRTVKEVKVDDEKLESVPEFYYLWNMLSAGVASWLRSQTASVLRASSGNCFPSLQPQPAASNPRLSVFNMHEECDAACSRDLGHDNSCKELPPA